MSIIFINAMFLEKIKSITKSTYNEYNKSTKILIVK